MGGVRIDASMETASLEKNIADINRRLDTFASGTKEVFKGLGVGLSIKGLESFVSQMGRLAAEGQKIQSLKAGFQALGGSFDWVAKAQASLKGTVDDTVLLQQANKILVAGLRPTGEQFAQIAEYGARYAQTLGIDAAGGIEKVTQAIARGRPKQLELLGFHITGKTRAEVQAQAVGQLKDRIAELPGIPNSVDTSFKALGVTLDQAQQDMGEAINKSMLFKKGLDDLDRAVAGIDMGELGRGFSNLAGIIAGTTGELIKFVNWLTDPEGIARGAGVFTDWAGGVLTKLTGGGGTFMMPEFVTATEQAMSSIAEEVRSSEISLAQFGENANAAGEAASGAGKRVHVTAEEVGNAGKKADQAAAALSKLQNKLQDLQTAQLESKLSGAIEGNDFALVEQLKPLYQQAVYEGQMAGLADYVAKAGPAGEGLAIQIAGAETQAKMEAINGQIKNGLIAVHGEAVDFWTTAFENAITGETFNLEDMFTQLAVGFAAELAAQVSEAMLGANFFNGITSLKDAGGTFAQFILGSGLPPEVAAITGGGSAAGGGGLFSSILGGAGGAGLLSTGVGEGFMAGVTGTAIAPTSAAASTAMSAGATVAAAAPYVAAAVAAYMIADKTGIIDSVFGGQTSKEELARRGFSEWITEKFNKLSTAAFMGPDGKMVMGGAQGFQFDVSDKDIEQAQGYFEGLDAGAQNTFSALGTALKRLAGLTEEQSAQIAAALSEDLLGNIDNARLLVYQLGLSFDELKGAILEAAKAGEIRWSEYNAQIAGLADAFEPGLKAVGAYGDAFQNLIDSGGRGMAALKAVKDTAVEGMEAGMTTVDQLGDALKAKGLDPEWVDAYVSAIKSKGINTLEELNSASEEVTGSIVGQMETASESLGESWRKMGEGIDELGAKMDAFAKRENIEKYVTVHAELDDPDNLLGGNTGGSGSTEGGEGGAPATPMARGGIVTRPMRALIGEAGPEAVIPLRSANRGLLNSLMGGGGTARIASTTYNIDARGAERGVSQEIMAALRATEDRAVERSVYSVLDGQQRGRF